MDREYREYRIDLRGVRDRSGLHDRIEQALPLPRWYGRNLDALYILQGTKTLKRACPDTSGHCSRCAGLLPKTIRV